MKNFVIDAVLTAVTPLNVTEAGSAYKKVDGSMVSPMPVALVNGQAHSCIPGSSARGAMRRAAVRVVNGKLIAKNGGQPVMGIKAFYWHVIGGIKLSKKDAGNDFKDIADVAPFTLVKSVRQRNPLMSLFGTFDPAPIAGHLQMSNAICEDAQVVIREDCNARRSKIIMLDSRPIVRSDPLQRDADVAEMLTPQGFSDWADMTAGAREASGLRRQIEDLEKQIRVAKRNGDSIVEMNAEIESLGVERDKVMKENKGSSVAIQQVPGSIEFIPQGSLMNQRIRVMNTNDVEMGLLLASLRNFADQSLLGGKRNIGCGEVTVKWNIKDMETRQVVAVVEAGMDDGFVIHSGEDFVNSKIKAWDDFADSAAFQTHYPTKEELKIAA